MTKKLLKFIKKSNSIKNLTHLYNLIIPFPNNPFSIGKYDFYQEKIKNLENKLEGKFKLTYFFIISQDSKDLKSFINDKNREDYDFKRNSYFKENLIFEENVYIGINISKIIEEKIYISFMYAKMII